MSNALKELGAHIEAKRPDCVLTWDVSHGELNVNVALPNIVGLVEFLKTTPPAGSRRWWISPAWITPSGPSGSTWSITS